MTTVLINASVHYALCVEDSAPRHTPMQATPPPRRRDDFGATLWQPYTVSDEAAKISAEPVSAASLLIVHPL